MYAVRDTQNVEVLGFCEQLLPFVRVCLCVWGGMCVHMRMCQCVPVSACVCTHAYVSVCACVRVCVCTHAYVSVCVCECVYVCVHMRMCQCVYVCRRPNGRLKLRKCVLRKRAAIVVRIRYTSWYVCVWHCMHTCNWCVRLVRHRPMDIECMLCTCVNTVPLGHTCERVCVCTHLLRTYARLVCVYVTYVRLIYVCDV